MDMTGKEEIGKRAAEAIASKAYDRFGDKIPIDVDPRQVADATYDIIRRKQEKTEKKRKRHHVILAVGIGIAATACLTVAIASIAFSKIDERVHEKDS